MLNQLKKQVQNLKKLNTCKALIFSGLLFPALAFSKPLLVFVDKNDTEISFQLKSNPTTGYRWKILSYDKSKLKFIKSQYIADRPQLMGSGGQEKFTFERLVKGDLDTNISLRYQRSWEPGKGPEQMIKISSDKK